MRGLALAVLLGTCVTGLLLGPSYAQKKEPPAARDALPVAVQATVADLLGKLSATDRELIRKTEKKDLIRFHRGLGAAIRNHYDLWGENVLLVEDACGKGCDPDRASMVIIEALWEALQTDT